MRISQLLRLATIFAILIVALAPTAANAEGPRTLATAQGQAAQEQAIEDALVWLRAQMAEDGSFDPTETGITIDAIMAIYAAGEDPNNWTSGSGNSPVDFLASQMITYTVTAPDTSPAKAGKAAMGAIAANRDPRHFGGMDVIARVTGYYSPSTGMYGTSTWDHALCMMALSAVCETIPTTATQALRNLQQGDGGWAFYDGYPEWDTTNVDNTGLCIQALIAVGVPPTDTAIISATNFISNSQTSSGGFPGWDGSDAAPTTAMGIQGLIAADVNPLTGTFTITGTDPITDPLTALMELQTPGGHFGGYNAVQTTAQAIPGLVGRHMPMRGRTASALAALEWLRDNQLPDGSWYGGSFATGVTLDAVFAIAAAGKDPNAWVSSGGNTPMDYLAENAISYTDIYPGGDPSRVGKLICGVVAGCGDPEAFGGRDWVTHLDGLYNGGTGQFGDRGWAADSYWDILAETALSQTVPVSATDWLEGEQQASGGWYTADGTPAWDAVNTNDTGYAAQSLVAAGVLSGTAVISDTVGYFQTQQQMDGGFCFADPAPWGEPESSPVNDALVIQALEASGRDPMAVQWRTHLTATDSITMVIHNPVENLLSFQSAATGGFPGYFGSDDAQFTAQVIPALLGNPLPVYCRRTAAYLPLICKDRS
jgi:hypothetical protein